VGKTAEEMTEERVEGNPRSLHKREKANGNKVNGTSYWDHKQPPSNYFPEKGWKSRSATTYKGQNTDETGRKCRGEEKPTSEGPFTLIRSCGTSKKEKRWEEIQGPENSQ